MDYQAFVNLAQTCEQMQEFISTTKAIIHGPINLWLTVRDTLPLLQIQTDKEVAGIITYGALRKFPIDYVCKLKQFRLKSLSIDAMNSTLTPEMAHGACNFIMENGLHPVRLSTNGFSPTQTAKLAKQLEASEVVFNGDAGGESVSRKLKKWRKKPQSFHDRVDIQSFAPEEFPDLCLLEIADTTIYEKCRRADFLMRIVRKAHIVILTTILVSSTAAQQIRSILKKYFEDTNRGVNKVVQIKIAGFNSTIFDFTFSLLEGYTYAMMKKNEAGADHPHFYYVSLLHMENGYFSRFYVHVKEFKNCVTVTFGSKNENVCAVAENKDIEL